MYWWRPRPFSRAAWVSTLSGPFFAAIYPLLEIVWVDAELMSMAIPLLIAANRRSLSLVDCCSFLIVQRLKVNKVFAFDRHFEERGFELLRA